MKSWATLVAVLALAVSGAALAQDSDGINIGTWNLNLAKSKYSTPGTAPKSETRVYEQTADGIHLTDHTETADGQSTTSNATFKYDGKPYPQTGNPNSDTVENMRVSSREIRVTLLRRGKVVGHNVISVSPNGKVMTMTTSMTNAAGKTQHDVRVYDRQ